VDCEPLSPLPPLHAPDAVQDVALLLDQASVEALPGFTVLGVALKVTLGALLETVTVADCVAEPPAPVHVTSYSVVFVRVGVCQTALVGTSPRQLPTVATQAVALADDQVRVDLLPLLMVVGEALNVTDGAADAAVGAGVAALATDTATAWVVVPPEPLQVSA
jgi:hypothetical protein